MPQIPKPLTVLKKFLPWVILCALLIPWLRVQMSVALNTNHAWLLIAAGRLLDGGHYFSDFYEPNPPLSILMYVPAALLARVPGIPDYYTPYLMALAGLALSATAVYALLHRWPKMDAGFGQIFTIAYILSGTLLSTALSFGERDAFVLWGLMPFLIIQIKITQNIPTSRWLELPVLVLGMVLILIKPHYLLFPCLLLLHRMFIQRRFFSLIRDADSCALATGTIVYAIVLWLFFRDYLLMILPDMVTLYIPMHHAQAEDIALTYAMLPVLLLTAAAFFDRHDPAIKTALICGVASILSVILFIFQGKGFFYHLIPALAFFFCGLSIFIYAATGVVMRRWPFMHLMLTLCLCLAMAAILMPRSGEFLTHKEYTQLPLVQLAASTAPDPIFIISENMDIVHQATLYSGTLHASRFPGLWWLPDILLSQRTDHAHTYSHLVTQDIQRYKPRKIAVITNLEVGGIKNFNFIRWLGNHDDRFRIEMAHYRKATELKDDRRHYFRGTNLDKNYPMIYDIYERVSAP